MEAIVVTEEISTLAGYSLHNQLAWRQENDQQIILAVGSPEEWNSSAALPPFVVTTNLVAASVTDPALARLLWAPFLSYLARSQIPIWWSVLPRLLCPSLPVLVRMPTVALSSAVCSAINGASGVVRFKATAAA